MSQPLLAFFRKKRTSVYLPIEIVYAFLAITAAVSPLNPDAEITSLFFRNFIVTALVATLIHTTQNFADFCEKETFTNSQGRNLYYYLAGNLLFNLALFLVIGGLFHMFMFRGTNSHFVVSLVGFAAITIYALLLHVISFFAFREPERRFGFFMVTLIPPMVLPLLFGALTNAASLAFAAFIPPHTGLLFRLNPSTFQLLIHSVLFVALFVAAIKLSKTRSEKRN